MGLAYSGYPNIYVVESTQDDGKIAFNLGKDMGTMGFEAFYKKNGILRIDRGSSCMVIVFENEEDITNFKLKYEKIAGVRPG